MAQPFVPERRRPLEVVVLGAVALVAAYLAVNLLAIAFVPVLHDFAFTVVVTERGSSRPIGGAAVSWKRTDPRSGAQWLEPIDRTGPDGRYTFYETLQERPSWAWPMRGRFRFSGLVLDVRAEHYRPVEVRVADVLPDVPYATGARTIRVELVGR